GAGRDALTDAKGKIVGASQVDFADNGDFVSSSAHLAADLGTGANFFRAGLNDDIANGVNSVDVSILGSTSAADKDDILVDVAFSSVGTSSYLNVFAGLGAGND